MKKNINIEKKINFLSMIGEVCAISLEHDLHFIDGYNVEGNLIVSGRYKATVASQVEEDFSEKIPVEIAFREKLDINNCKIDITDFKYDIVDSSNLKCIIELSIEGDEILDDVSECDGDLDKEVEIPKLENVVEEISEIEEDEDMSIDEDDKILEEDEEIVEESNSLFNIEDSETFGTFIVYIVRQNETINSILEKYNTTLEEIEKYNDIKDLSIGTKLIIPILNDEDKQ